MMTEHYEDIAQCMCQTTCDITTILKLNITPSERERLDDAIKQIQKEPEVMNAITRLLAVSKMEPYFLRVLSFLRELIFDYDIGEIPIETLLKETRQYHDRIIYAGKIIPEVFNEHKNQSVVTFFVELLTSSNYFHKEDESESRKELDKVLTIIKDL